MVFLRFMMITIGLLLIASAVGAVAFAPKLEPYARQAMTAQLKNVLGTEVSIGRLRPAWSEGALALEDVTIFNPPNFKEGTAAQCDRVLIQPEMFTVFSKSPTIACVTMEGTSLKLRYTPSDGTNFGYFKKRAVAAAEMTPASGEGVVVKEVRAQGAKVDLVAGPTINVDLAPLALGAIAMDSKTTGGAAKAVVGIIQAVMMESASLQGMMQPLVDLLKVEGQPGAAPAPPAAVPVPATSGTTTAPPTAAAPVPAKPTVSLDIPEI